MSAPIQRCQPEADAPRHLPAPWHVDPLTASIYASNVPKGPARVADMRGWGYLTGKGHGALALSQDEAIDIQRANAAFIVEAVNSHEDLLARLGEATLLINEGSDALEKLMKAEARVEELTKALKATREQLIKVRDASPEIRNHELETNQVIAQAWHTLNDTGVATPLERSGGAT